jgi:hypothetical protein
MRFGVVVQSGGAAQRENMEAQQRGKRMYRNTLGSIVSWAIFRAAAVIFGAWLLNEYAPWLDYGVWWGVTLISIYAIVIHPITIQYHLYKQDTSNVVSGTLCSTCRHFEKGSVLCLKLDEHVSEDDIPCEGELWEPKGFDDDGD